MSSPSEIFWNKTFADLEWEAVARAVLDRCVGPAKERPGLELAASHDGAIIALAEAREARSLLDGGEPIPLDGLRDLRPAVMRLSRGGALDGPSLIEVASVVACARALRRFLGSRRNRVPALFLACSTDPTLDGIEDTIRAAVDPDGTLSDRASPELRRLRSEAADIRARLVARLEEQIRKQEALLSDRFYTVREGRYVLPVRADAHERVHGIVHAASASGATVYVEPRANVPLGNRLKMADAELEREIARILSAISDHVREHVVALEAAIDALDHADLRRAGALYGRDHAGALLDLASDSRIELRRARHPVLAIQGVDVVPNDLALAGGRALVISGPNAGGKTVALKVLGLAALSARAAIPFPADEGGVCGFFDPILTDVGDDQSLAKNLSTFSAHMSNVASMLQVAGPRSLVLLDELAGGTDPDEGAALACAVVHALVAKGAAVSVTTHYEALKAIATTDPNMKNASVRLDRDHMLPTFELVMDVPGASSAFWVARRFGVPEAVVETAKALLPERSRSFDALVRKLEHQSAELALEKATLADARKEAAAALSAAAEHQARLREKEKEFLTERGSELVAQLTRARRELREARAGLREREQDAASLREAERRLEAVAAQVASGGALDPDRDRAPAEGFGGEPIRVGMRVFVPRLKAELEVIEEPSHGRVRVAAGAMKMWVDLAELRKPDAPAKAQPPQKETRIRARVDVDDALDVRGMRAEDAVSMVESFLDRVYGAAGKTATVTHGFGTGSLRDAVRAYLSRPSPYVASFRPGTEEEGGDRVTVIALR